jgi:hypothetical protein
MDSFDAVCASATEQEQCVAVWIQLKVILNDIDQAIQLFAHVGVSCTDIDPIDM